MVMFLERANDDLVSWCTCPPGESLLKVGTEAACPWCGCGWLLGCITCRKASAFGRGVDVGMSYEDLARRDIRTFNEDLTYEPKPKEVRELAAWLRQAMAHVEVGKLYVNFDQRVVAADASALKLVGQIGSHDLPYVPQVRALTDPNVQRDVLTNRRYWDRARQIKDHVLRPS